MSDGYKRGGFTLYPIAWGGLAFWLICGLFFYFSSVTGSGIQPRTLWDYLLPWNWFSWGGVGAHQNINRFNSTVVGPTNYSPTHAR
ncbi:hypothetical protein [Leptolyngbya sp. FACHB-261]|uniref:hypothetical protein n=1 Tax=Leptolyngbya sp. FACHB-261 TaxID=2692806 RepID=UPI001682A9D3|nr:hypothetical protein [Leptolyngbya sp. FACHB-261]MBD2105186.1 hypothetical protein [Leptolyngbya sp. FACHB-261]